MRDKIENYFSQTQSIYRGILTKKEGKWFNGKTYYPLYNYSIRSEKLLLEYSFQSNEYSSSKVLLPSKSDIHKIQMSYSFPSNLKGNYSISSKYNLFTLLLKGHNGYQIVSNNSNLKDYLNKDQFISKIFKTFFDPEFSPIITGTEGINSYTIQIRFNLVRFNPNIFTLINKFITDFETKYC